MIATPLAGRPSDCRRRRSPPPPPPASACLLLSCSSASARARAAARARRSSSARLNGPRDELAVRRVGRAGGADGVEPQRKAREAGVAAEAAHGGGARRHGGEVEPLEAGETPRSSGSAPRPLPPCFCSLRHSPSAARPLADDRDAAGRTPRSSGSALLGIERESLRARERAIACEQE